MIINTLTLATSLVVLVYTAAQMAETSKTNSRFFRLIRKIRGKR